MEVHGRKARPNGAGRLLKIKIKALFEANNEEYGYRRIHAALVRGGEQVDDELVRQLMRELDLVPCQPQAVAAVADRAGRGRADSGPGQSRFLREKPGEKMVGDITYIPIPGRAGFISPWSSTARPA